MTFLEMARLTLEKSKEPLTYDEIWNKGIEYGYAKEVLTKGKTPERTVAAQIYINIRDEEKSQFCVASKRPTRFALSSWNKEEVAPQAGIKTKKPEPLFKERDLHQLLAYFCYYYLNILTRTIDDKISKNGIKGKNEWLHPDMVGLDIASIKGFRHQ